MPMPRRSRAPADAVVLPADELLAVLRAARDVHDQSSLHRAAGLALDTALSLIGAEEGSVQLLEDDGRTLRMTVARGLPPAVVVDARSPVGEGIAGHVAATGRAVLLGTRVDVGRFPGFVPSDRRIEASLCVPILHRQRLVGVMNLSVTTPGKALTDADLRRAAVLAEAVAAAFQMAGSYRVAAQRGDTLGRLADAGAALIDPGSLPELSASALDGLETLLGPGRSLLAVLAPDGSFELAMYRGFAPAEVEALLASAQLGAVLTPSPAAAVRGLTAAGTGSGRLAAVQLGGGGRCLGALVRGPGGPAGDASALQRDRASDDALLAAYAPSVSIALLGALQQRATSAAERKLAAVLAAAPNPMVMIDRDNRFEAINPAAAEALALSPDFQIGAPVAGALRSGALESLCRSDDPASIEVVVGAPARRALEARMVVLGGGPGAGSVSGAKLLVLEDITPQRDIERLKENFVAMIGHELRTPITVVKGYVRTLVRHADTMPAAVRRQALEAVEAQTTRLEQLLEDLLFLSGISTKAPALEITALDAAAVLVEVVNEFRAMHPDRIFELRTPDAVPLLDADRAKLQQALRHLMDNAVKYSPGGEPVTVQLGEDAGSVTITVVDLGDGIFSGDLPRLFERFGQLDGSSTRKRGGTGVGLHIAKTLVQAHSGRISAKSTLGKGSAFTIAIPKGLLLNRRADVRALAAQPSST